MAIKNKYIWNERKLQFEEKKVDVGIKKKSEYNNVITDFDGDKAFFVIYIIVLVLGTILLWSIRFI